MKSINKKRLIYLTLFGLLFLTEVLIALFVHDRIIRPYGGDVIVVWVVYCFARIFVPEKFKLMPLWVFLFAVFVEITQYINLVNILGIPEGSVLRVIMGSAFSFVDIGCYALGCIIIVIVQIIIKRIQRRA